MCLEDCCCFLVLQSIKKSKKYAPAPVVDMPELVLSPPQMPITQAALASKVCLRMIFARRPCPRDTGMGLADFAFHMETEEQP